MFRKTPKHKLREARGLIRRKKWNEAIAILSSLRQETGIDQSELKSLYHQAREGFVQETLAVAQRLLRRKRHGEALELLQELSNEFPEHPDVKRLIGRTKDAMQSAQRPALSASTKWVIGGAIVFILLVIYGSSNDSTDQRGTTDQNATETKQAVPAVGALTQEPEETGTIPIGASPTSTFSSTPKPPPSATKRSAAYTDTPVPSPVTASTSSPTMVPTATLTLTSTNTSTATATDTQVPSVTPTFTPVHGNIKGANVNARSCPSTDCAPIAVLGSFSDVTVLGVDGDWYWVELADGRRAYIFGNLIQLSEGAVVFAAPTLTPTFTPTSTPTSSDTPRPSATYTATATPFKFSQEDLFVLVELTMISGGLEVNDIWINGRTLVVDAPASHDEYDSELDYRMSYVGALTGALVGGYRSGDVVATPPQQVTVNFQISGLTLVRVTYQYRDAEDFVDGRITAMQFVARWTVE